MLGKVKERLQNLGYELKENDEAVLSFCLGKVIQTIKNDCNVPAVPDGLVYIAIDMTIGEFLTAKRTFSPKDLTGFDLDYAVKQIQQGDTTTVFATGEGTQTDEQRLTAFINYLLTYGRDQFSCFRRLRW